MFHIYFVFATGQNYFIPLQQTSTYKIVCTTNSVMRKKNSTNFLNETDLVKNCGMFYTLSVIGGRWKVGILASLLDNEVLRYSEIKNKLPNITERMLIKQLKELQDDGLIVRKDYQEIPPKVEYSISKKGKTLEDVLAILRHWGKKYRNGQP
ncbi:helix-turn-helix domain-containing protein [Niabella aquatica]